MSLADHYLDKEKSSDNTDALVKLLGLLTSDESKVQLSEEHKKELTAIKQKCSYQTKSLLDIYRQKLWKRWKDFSDPLMDLKTAVTVHEGNKTLAEEVREKKIKEDASSSGASHPLPLIREFRDTVIEVENAEFVFDAATNSYSDKPIRYSKKIEWEDFSEQVHLNPYSGTIDLYKTMIQIMDECTRIGCDRVQLCKVYKLFVRNHIPESWNSLSYEQDPETIFDILMGLLDVAGHLSRLKNCLSMVIRKPLEGITTPVRSYQSLITEILSLQSPNSSDKENRDQAIKEASKAVKYFVTKPVWAEVQRYKEIFRNKNNRFPLLSEIFEFIGVCETKPGMAPTSKLSLGGQDARIDLFLTDTQQTWTAHFGDDDPGDSDQSDEGENAEVHTNEADYVNMQGSPYGSTGSTIAAHRVQTRGDAGALRPPLHGWGDHPSPKKDKGKKNVSSKTKSSGPFPYKSLSRSSGGPRGSGSGSASSGRRSRPGTRPASTTGRDGASPRGSRQGTDRAPASTSRSRDQTSSERPKSPQAAPRSPHPSRSGSASSAGSGKSPGAPPWRRSRTMSRSPSPGKCWMCFRSHPPNRCIYGRVNPVNEMCPCGQGYHHRVICLSDPPRGKPKTGSKDPRNPGKKKEGPFMPHKPALN